MHQMHPRISALTAFDRENLPAKSHSFFSRKVNPFCRHIRGNQKLNFYGSLFAIFLGRFVEDRLGGLEDIASKTINK